MTQRRSRKERTNGRTGKDANGVHVRTGDWVRSPSGEAFRVTGSSVDRDHHGRRYVWLFGIIWAERAHECVRISGEDLRDQLTVQAVVLS